MLNKIFRQDGFLCEDNCPLIANSKKDDQGNIIRDENGKPVQDDRDKDGIGDACDNCPDHPNRDQKDSDGSLSSAVFSPGIKQSIARHGRSANSISVTLAISCTWPVIAAIQSAITSTN